MIPLSSRRTFLKGLPASLAGLAASSPFWDRLISRAAAQEVTQKRFVIFFVPDGVIPEWFWHETPGPLTIRSDRSNDFAGTTFNTAIPKADWPLFLQQPIAKYSPNTLLVKGINNAGTNDHVMTIQSVLTGEEVTAKNQAGGPSIDVIMAEANKTSRHIVPVFRTGVYVKQTKLTGAGAPFRERNASVFIEPSSSITTDAKVVLDKVSGRASTGGTTPPPSTSGPSPAEIKAKTRIAALGAVQSRIEAMKCTGGNAAAKRLEQYLADLERVEKLEAMVATETPGTTATPFKIPALLDPNNATVKTNEGDIRRLPDVAPFLRELVVTALALDYAPAVTMQWGATGVNKISGNTLTDYRYDFLPNLEYKGAGEHGLAHPEDAKFKEAGHNITGAISTRDRVRIRRWLFNELNLLLNRLAETADGSGTLLDNTTILYASEYGGGNANSPAGQHSNRNLPYMIIGGKNSPFKVGNGVTVTNRTHGDFLYTLAKGFGSTVTAVGKGKATIDGILK
jgi:hypothetical protein